MEPQSISFQQPISLKNRNSKSYESQKSYIEMTPGEVFRSMNTYFGERSEDRKIRNNFKKLKKSVK